MEHPCCKRDWVLKMVCLKYKTNSRLSIKVPNTRGSYFWERSAWHYTWWFLGSFFRATWGILHCSGWEGASRWGQAATEQWILLSVSYQTAVLHLHCQPNMLFIFVFPCFFACFPRNCCNCNLDHQEVWCKAKRVSEPSCCSAFLSHRQLFLNWVFPFKLWVMVITFGMYLCGLVLSFRDVKLLLIP